MAGGHGCMGSNTVIAETSRTTSPNGRPVVFHQHADHLQRRNCVMPLIEMQDRRVNLKCVKCPQPADAQQ